MTVVSTPEKRRPRRIAADEAHAWARNLRLHNSLAKLTLCMTTGYVNGEGICFVGIESLAEDTELSPDTVRKRLGWLEGIGVIARFPQWIDAAGRRNGEGKGRRTSDEIRLLLNADPDEIERRAKGNDGGDSGAPDPSPQQGLNHDQDSVSPPVALCQPSDSGKGLTSEPEPEVRTPNPLSGGVQAIEGDQELEPDVAAFRDKYPAPITNLPRLRNVLAAMTAPERTQVLTAVEGYANFIAGCQRKGKPRAVKDADRWVAGGLWQGYVATGAQAQANAQRISVATDSAIGTAWATINRIGHATPLESSGLYHLPRSLNPQEMALSRAPPESQWLFVPAEEGNRVRAWNDLIAGALAGRARPSLVWERNPGGRRGFMAPYAWPPRVDGSLCTGPPQESPSLSDDDIEAFANQ